ncbi:hypothetical protein FKP32DRAFT_1069643 [Trametes sanguinea]|nr:hypothetical protein FKP32DRAFT_1069643 [Trametes sanguinea]
MSRSFFLLWFGQGVFATLYEYSCLLWRVVVVGCPWVQRSISILAVPHLHREDASCRFAMMSIIPQSPADLETWSK